jgi:hypothetical protein
MKEDMKEFGNWQPIETAPKDEEFLAIWGTCTSGAMGYDIIKHKYGDKWESVNSGDTYPANGYILLAWSPLPAFPNLPTRIAGISHL